MLTGYQCEVVAFIAEGGFICSKCAHEALDAGEFARSERGLGDLSPVIRYSLDEDEGEMQWENAREHVSEFEDDHPGLDLSVKHGWGTVFDHLVDHYAESHPYHETCEECGEEIAP